MDVTIFIETCARENPIDLYNITLGSLIEEVPEDEADKHNLMVMTIDLLADTLYEEKEFEKAA